MPVSLILTPGLLRIDLHGLLVILEERVGVGRDDVVGEGVNEPRPLLGGGALEVGADDAECGEAAVNVGHQLLADDGPHVERISLELRAAVIDAREELPCRRVDHVIRILLRCESGEDERCRDENCGESPECDVPHSSYCSFLPEAASEAGFSSALPSPESDDFAPML